MGRKKSYEPSRLVDLAVGVFHAHGFEGTSTQMLVERLGVNRNSMYTAFESKQALFDAALERYEARVLSALFGALEAPGAGLDGVAALLGRFAEDAKGPARGLGCLLCNTAVELAGADPSGARFVGRYFERMEAAYAHALGNARRARRLARGVVVADEARLLTATTLGLFVLVRGAAPAAVVGGAVSAARRHLKAISRAPAAGARRRAAAAQKASPRRA